MMDAIGQKAVIPVIDEAVAATEYAMESGENGENKVFDATLEQMLAELPLNETLLEELLAEDGLSASLNSVLLTQNQLDPEIDDTDFGIVNNSNMPLEMLEADLWNEDVSSLQAQVLKKTTPISAEMIEVLDPRFAVNGSNISDLPETGIAETGLQSLVQESTAESSEPLLQTVFHQVNSLGNGTVVSAEEQQKQSKSTPFTADAELSTSDLKAILQKTATQSVIPQVEQEISNSEFQSNPNKVVQAENAVVQELSSILQNQEESLQENLQTAFRKGSQEESLDTEKLGADNLPAFRKGSQEESLDTEKLGTEKLGAEKLGADTLLKLKRGDVPLTPEKIKAAESLQVVEKFKTNEALQAAEKLQGAKELQGGAREKPIEEGLLTSEKFQVADEFKSGTKSKLEAGFHATEKFKLAEELQSGAKTQNTENLQMSGVENKPDVSEKGSEQSLNQFRTLTAKDTQFSASSKSSAELVSPTGINSLAEVSGTSMAKGATTNTSAEPLRGADLPFNMEQVVSRVRILRGNGVEVMTLRLHPEDLGQITLKIRLSGADLSIDMRVDNPQAKLLVESGFDSLRSKFLDQEFSFQDLALNVDINERDSQFSRDRKNSAFEEDMNSKERGKKEEVAAVEETPRVINRNDSGLNLYV